MKYTFFTFIFFFGWAEPYRFCLQNVFDILNLRQQFFKNLERNFYFFKKYSIGTFFNTEFTIFIFQCMLTKKLNKKITIIKKDNKGNISDTFF